MKLTRNVIGYMVLSVLIVPTFAFGQTGSVTAKSTEATNVKLFVVPPQKGQKSDAVRDLQRMLATDPAIYPKGLVTGYFGPATEAAVKKLQVQYGLPGTGVVDDATQNIFVPPHVRLTVLTPNGGETWDRSKPQTVQWESYTWPVMYLEKQILPSAGSPTAPGFTGNVVSEVYPRPFFGHVSIDLVRDSNPGYLYHIGTAELYQSSFTWSLPQDIAAGSDFRVRISIGGQVPCYWAQDASMPMENRVCPMYYPIYSASDTSDGTFTISGGVTPDPQVIAKLKAQVAEMETTLNMLLRQLQAMKEVLARL